MKMIIRWRTPALLLMMLISSTLAAEEVPPGLVTKDSDQDLVAEASVQQAQKREATLSNSYGEPIPPDAYGIPDLQINVPEHQPAPIYGVPELQNIGFQTPPGAYGPPTPINLPPSGYGPPQPSNIPATGYEGPPPPVGPPKQIYGPPKQNYGPPRQSYGPPPKQEYGPPPKQDYGPPPRQEYGPPPKQDYGPPPRQEYGLPPKQEYGPPPKQTYGPPKPVYGPPKKNHLPSKQSLPKPSYGPPFKPQKLHHPKPIYGPPKQTYGPPKQDYGPPKQDYVPPRQEYGPPRQEYGPPKQDFGPPKQIYGPPMTNYGVPQLPLQDLPPISLPPINLPPPIYGTPVHNLPELRPNFPLPTDTYGPPGLNLGPIDQVLIHDIDNNVNYGPPQPDPNPRPPHPGIPAPPTPPHVLYDGWKPIPGVSLPNQEQIHHHGSHQEQSHHHQQISHHQIDIHGPSNNHLDHQGPSHLQEQSPHQINNQEQSHHQINHQEQSHHQINHQEQSHHQNHHQEAPHHQTNIEVIDIHHQDLPSLNQVNFQAPQVQSGYSNVHQDVLANIDLNAIVGGDSNGIDQSKTVFEAHYTEPQQPTAPNNDRPLDSYGVPLQLPNIQYHGSFRQHGAKGLVPPSGVYGVPPGTSYGVPPQQYGPPKNGLPIPHGSSSGGGHNGLPSPRHPIKFRESIPNGVIQHIGSNHFKDEFKQGPAYLPPPVREVKDINQQTGNHGFTMSIEPSNLFSLPHENNPVSFLNLQMPSNLYGSPIDSYSVPLHTVADNSAAGSSVNSITAALDGTILNNLSNLDAAAILKHCPYHEAILKAAQRGEAIPSDIAASYVASLSSLGTSLSKSQQTLISPQNGFNTPEPGSESVNYNSKDLATASNTLTEVILPNNSVNKERDQNGKSMKDTEKYERFNEDNKLNVSEQILKTSEKIKNLSEETKLLQQKIVSTSNNINQISGHLINYKDIPVKGKHGAFSYQIQSSDGSTKPSKGVPHEQLLSEGLLQSILEAIEHPQHPKKPVKPTKLKTPHMDLSNIDLGGLVLPAGYEPIDHTKVNKGVNSNQDLEVQSSNLIYSFNQQSHDCKRPSNLVTETIIRPSENLSKVAPVYEVGNDVAVYFNDKIDDKIDSNERTDEQKNEHVTEISVATSISEDYGRGDIGPEFGDRIQKKE